VPRALNPFTWTDVVQSDNAVPRQAFTERVALTLKGGTHVSLFGPRGTGKSSFLLEEVEELARDHGPDAPPWSMIIIDLRTAISIPAFVGVISAALGSHPDNRLRRRATNAFRDLEKEIGINLGVFKAGVRTRGTDLNDEVILRSQLAALPKVSERLVIAFDEFQRLNNCPGEPLSQIRSALMGPEHAGHVSLLFTGSLRERLQLMLKTDTEPIWDQAHDMDLPDLPFDEFVAYIEFRFESSGRPIRDEAAEHLVRLGSNHPKRTQQLAWNVWEAADDGETIDVDLVDETYEELVSSEDQVAQVVDKLLGGDDAEVNEARALFLIGSGESPGSRKTAKTYGLTDESAAIRAVDRLRSRGLVTRGNGDHRIVDPLLAEWLRRNSPIR
jgi:hypothetical protein